MPNFIEVASKYYKYLLHEIRGYVGPNQKFLEFIMGIKNMLNDSPSISIQHIQCAHSSFPMPTHLLLKNSHFLTIGVLGGLS